MSNEEEFKHPSANTADGISSVSTEKEFSKRLEENQQDITTAAAELMTYTSPSWEIWPSSAADSSGFANIEVIKNGVHIDTLRLHEAAGAKSFVSIGRFAPPCDIQLEHPSVSRVHCILQYGMLLEKAGWYLYDMGSTHGTRLNKKTVKAKTYVPLQPGHVFQVAGW